jgi:hypothetical protein
MTGTIPYFDGETWVAFTDLCGTKVMYNENPEVAAKALDTFYNTVFDIHQETNGICTIAVSDCAIFWLNEGVNQQTNLHTLLNSLKALHRRMIDKSYLLRTTVAYGNFKYQQRLEIAAIRKDMFVGSAYLDAYANNDKIQPGQIGIVKSAHCTDIKLCAGDLHGLVFKIRNSGFWEYFWSVNDARQIQRLKEQRARAYKATAEKLKEYSPKTFLRQTPNKTLKEYFARKDLLRDIDFDKLGETEIDTIAQAMEALPEKQRNNIEAELRQINEMACEKGILVLIEEAGSVFHEIDLLPIFEPMKNHYEKAFWVFLNQPLIFGIASDLAYMDSIGSWSSRKVGAGLTPAVEEKDKRNLADSVSEFYKKQGRGQRCHVDNYLRQQPERHCYFVYPEDYATTELGFDDEGKFYHRLRKPAFEVIFVYRPESGILEVSAKGGKKVVEALQEIFCKTILGLDGLPKLDKRHFDLSKLSDKTLKFVTEPADGIEKVILRMLRLDLPPIGNRRITLEASPSEDAQPVYTLIEKALNKSNISLDKAVISRAKIQIDFAGRDGKKGKSRTFEISSPNRCTLKDDPLDQIAKKYLEKWGFVTG